MADPAHVARGLAGEEIPEGEDRILTIPNLITLVRAACIPWFVWLLFAQDDRLSAAILLAALGATDWVDGYVARHFGQVSNLGKMFDPTVDRLLMVVGIGSIMLDDLGIDGFMVFAWIVVIREVVLSAFVVLTVVLGARRMDVTWFGKAGTFAMMIAFPAFLASADDGLAETTASTVLLAIAWIAAIPGLILSMIAFFGYLPEGIRAIREGREQKRRLAAGLDPGEGSEGSEGSDGSAGRLPGRTAPEPHAHPDQPDNEVASS